MRRNTFRKKLMGDLGIDNIILMDINILSESVWSGFIWF
jgi:hypothetical protein